jgi:hypothetical protein
VRPAVSTRITLPLILDNAVSKASCTEPPDGWLCHPQKLLPSYSRTNAILTLFSTHEFNDGYHFNFLQ